MEFAFNDRDFRDLCFNEALAKRELGVVLALKLKLRLADLAAVSVAAEIFSLPGRPRELTGQRRGDIAIDLVDYRQLIIRSGHTTPRMLVSGDIDWAKVRRIKLIGLEANHA